MENEGKGEGLGKLAAKIVAIGAELGVVAKDGNNPSAKYDYISYEHLNARLRPLLAKHKLAIVPRIDSIEEKEHQREGKAMVVRSVVKGSMLVVDAETGFSMECPFVGADQDWGGKSSAQAITEFVKRFELKLFHVSAFGDSDPDQHTVSVGLHPEESRVSESNPPEDVIAWIRSDDRLSQELYARKVSSRYVKELVTRNKFDKEKIWEELKKTTP
jgi:hypothetical protein